MHLHNHWSCKKEVERTKESFPFLWSPKTWKRQSWIFLSFTEEEKEEKKEIWQSIKKMRFMTDCQMPEIFKEDFTSWFIEDL